MYTDPEAAAAAQAGFYYQDCATMTENDNNKGVEF